MSRDVQRQNWYGLAVIALVAGALSLIAAAPGSGEMAAAPPGSIPAKILQNSLTAQSRLRQINNALWIYANDNRDRLPPDLSMLYPNYISDPAVFWNPGDSDPAPTTIDNNTPNTLNSTRISFEYAAGPYYPNCPDAPVIWDNSAANNGGFYTNVVRADNKITTTPYIRVAAGDSTYAAMNNLHNLINAYYIYANENRGFLPDDPAVLLERYLCSPATFWNPGDSDPEPTAITNSTPNAVNSSHISFDFFYLGRDLDTIPMNAVVIQDNSIANNGGSGIIKAYADGHVEWTPVRHLASAIISGPDTFQEGGGSGSYTCTAVFDDGTTRDVTSLARWGVAGPGEMYHPGYYVAPASVSYDTPATITASYTEFGGAVIGNKTITIQNIITLQSLSIISGPATLPEGGTGSYACLATYDDGSVRDVTSSATWSVESGPGCFSAAGAYAAPSSVQADTPVLLRATFTDNGVTKTGDKNVTVLNTVRVLTNLAITGPASVAEGSTGSYTCTATYDDNGTQNVTGSALWSVGTGPGSFSSPGSFVAPATVLTDTPATISASYSSGGVTKQAEKAITVTNSLHGLSGLAITSGPSSVPEAGMASYTCTASYDDGSTKDVTSAATWSIPSGPGSFSSAGAYVAPGTVLANTPVTLMAQYAEAGVTKQAEKGITVTNTLRVLASIAISSGPAEVQEAGTGTYVCTATYDDGVTQDVTATGVWAVSGPGSFSTQGVYAAPTGILSNTPVVLSVSYTEGTINKQATKNVTVTNAVRVLTGVSITSGPTSVPEGHSGQYVCTAAYDDGSGSNVTATATWSVTAGPGSFASPGEYAAPASLLSDTSVTIHVSYMEGGITKQADKTLTASNTVRGLTKLSFTSGPATVLEGATAQYSCLATYDDDTVKTVTTSATWSLTLGPGSFSAPGTYVAPTTVPGDTPVTLKAAYTEAGVTRDATRGITITRRPLPDTDNDGVPDVLDVCPNTPRLTVVDERGCFKALDGDGDGVADERDLCPTTPNGTQVDTSGCPLPDRDHDGAPDVSDNCLMQPNTDQRDRDGDGVGDACDECPEDPYKSAPGTCGCGVVDVTNCGRQTYTVRIDTPNGAGAPTQFLSGTTARITAPPAPEGMHFSNWSGDLTGSENPASLLVDSDKTVIANYEACPTEQTVPCAPGVPVCAAGTMLVLGIMKRRPRRHVG